MPEVIVKYKNAKTLEILKSLSKYFDFIISKPKQKTTIPAGETFTINGITAVRGNSSIDISDLSDVFTGKNIDARQLRKSAWGRNK